MGRPPRKPIISRHCFRSGSLRKSSRVAIRGSGTLSYRTGPRGTSSRAFLRVSKSRDQSSLLELTIRLQHRLYGERTAKLKRFGRNSYPQPCARQSGSPA